MREYIPMTRNGRRLENRVLKDRVSAAESVLPHGTTISEQSLALYLSPYEQWERDLVRYLDRQPRSPVWTDSDVSSSRRLGLCHHNVQSYCRFDQSAKHVLGWFADGSGYILHSVVDIDGFLCDVTPYRMPINLPFVRDDTLILEWIIVDGGKTRAVITREGREIPMSLRTPKAAREFRQFALANTGLPKTNKET